MIIIRRKEIERLVDLPAILKTIEEGFVIYSKKQAVIPPVTSMNFENPPGDCHIKYGYSRTGRYYVIKVASSFPGQSPSGNGMMLLFDKQSGQPVSMLLDEGYLTDLRTAAAGCIAAKYLAPKNVSCIGIVGTGTQAAWQLELLPLATDCKEVMVWGRDRAKADRFCQNPRFSQFQFEVAKDLDQLTARCNLIVTTTSAHRALLFAKQIRKGTHITALGADDAGKQELEPALLAKADRVVVDSRSQCALIGDASYALKEESIQGHQLIELGEVIENVSLGRTSEQQITIADLTGVAIQDLQVASFILNKYYESHEKR